jgi:hypothetical protein
MPDIAYKYFGILVGDRTPDNPAGVVRVWTDEGGREREQTFTPDLIWKTSYVFDPLTRPTNDRLVEIDQQGVDQFVERVKQKFGPA